MVHEIEQAASYHFDPILLPAILLAVTDIIRIEEAIGFCVPNSKFPTDALHKHYHLEVQANPPKMAQKNQCCF